MVDNLKQLKGKRIKITYNSMFNEVSRDDGIFNDIDDDFIQLILSNQKVKFISLNKIIRVEEI